MPESGQTTLLAVSFAVLAGKLEKRTQDGELVEEIPVTNLVFEDTEVGRQWVVPLPEEARQELARQLTGGIVLPNGNPVV